MPGRRQKTGAFCLAGDVTVTVKYISPKMNSKGFLKVSVSVFDPFVLRRAVSCQLSRFLCIQSKYGTGLHLATGI